MKLDAENVCVSLDKVEAWAGEPLSNRNFLPTTFTNMRNGQYIYIYIYIYTHTQSTSFQKNSHLINR